MTRLGTVLELLHDAPNRWTTIRATVRERRAVPPSETTTRIWIGEGGLVREEVVAMTAGADASTEMGTGDTLGVLSDPSRLIPSFDFEVLGNVHAPRAQSNSSAGDTEENSVAAVRARSLGR